jgi:hypothetical protein
MPNKLPTWVLFPTTTKWFTDPQKLAQVIREVGYPVVISPNLYEDPSAMAVLGCVVAYGPYQIMERITSWRCCVPAAWSVRGVFDCDTRFGRCGCLAPTDFAIVPGGGLCRCRDSLFERFGGAGHLYLRPDGILRPHHFTRLQFDSWTAMRPCSERTFCAVTAPVHALKRHRFFIHRAEPFTGESCLGLDYSYCGDPCKSPHLMEAAVLAAKLLRKTAPPIYCLDLLESQDGALTIKNLVSVNTACVFKADLHEIVRRASVEAVKAYKASPPISNPVSTPDRLSADGARLQIGEYEFASM